MKFVSLNDSVNPSFAKKFDAGMDLRYYSKTGEVITFTKNTVYMIPTGVFAAIPEGKCGIIFEKSGRGCKNGLHVLGRIIDQTYRGEIVIICVWYADFVQDYSKGKVETRKVEQLVLNPGDKIAQMVILNYSDVLEQVASIEELGTTERGTAGFGSTDNKVVGETVIQTVPSLPSQL